ncbi:MULTISPECIES: glycosyltransferase family 4 protein [Fischerella]|uniref:Glycosyltransferase family 1 protein n=1 Tax=Fischerella muscicola CCMEE 5323 TaxID=2019572 RepID=A0A2N6K9E7_FISMU|nr:MULTISPECIES: glycosyltransferase family 4 protein [Fischerella]MBD2434056.1 glycosyltransferase family 4 protein [Fischerella sp. FACHB-380]PLZ94615.1 glycosyltransferase family 1 protein [Fischerella muscicola CCMEE 5323]
MHLIVLELEPTSCRGGQEIVLFDVCRGLAQRGHTISLVYTKEGNLLEQYQKFCSHVIKANLFTIYPPQYSFHFIADIWNLNSNIPVTENSVLLSNQYQDTFFARALSLSKNIPLVCYLHLPPSHRILVRHTETKNVKQVLRESYIRWQWQTGLKGVKQFIAVSNQTKQEWVKNGYPEDRIEVVHNGINLEINASPNNFYLRRKEWNILEDTRVISYVGRLDPEKGLETLIKAFAILLKSGAKTQLLIAGKPINEDEEYQKSLEQLTIDLGINNYVSFLGHITNTTNLYQVSDVTVLPSLWSEPFGRVIVESMACGTPVVASCIGGIPEILTGEFQKGLFEPGNERDLSDTLNQIINWRENDSQLGKRCREHVLKNFSLDKMIDGVEKVLERRFSSARN